MNTQIVIVLGILLFLMVMLMTNKVPYGVSCMTCCVLFVILGVTDIGTAFSGLSSSTTVMIATMLVVATALGKTSFINNLRGKMFSLQGGNNILLVGAMFLFTIILAQFMGQIACISMMILFIQSLDEESDVTPSRMIFAIACINTLWTSKVPIGMGATMPSTINSFYEGMTDVTNLLQLTDYFKAGVIPAIAGTIYCLFAYKLIPSHKIELSNVKDDKNSTNISKRNENIIYAIFISVILGFMFSNKLGNMVNIIPAVGVLVLIYTKVLSVKEVVSILTSDMVWMIAGMSAVSTVMGQSGVGELIGETILHILGNNPSPLFVIAVFCIVTTTMTNFMSNMGTMALMTPIAAATAIAGGINIKTLVLVVAISSWFAIVLPTGSSATMMAFGMGKHNPFKVMKFTIPLLIICMVSLILSVSLFFPVYI